MSTTDTAFDARNRANTAHIELVARATVLSRLFELLSAVHSQKPCPVDFGTQREADFWDGLRMLTEEIVERAQTMERASEDQDVVVRYMTAQLTERFASVQGGAR